MRPPYGTGPHDSQVPDDDEAVCIPRDEAVIVPDEGCRVDLSLVPSKHRLGLQRRPVGHDPEVEGVGYGAGHGAAPNGPPQLLPGTVGETGGCGFDRHLFACPTVKGRCAGRVKLPNADPRRNLPYPFLHTKLSARSDAADVSAVDDLHWDGAFRGPAGEQVGRSDRGGVNLRIANRCI